MTLQQDVHVYCTTMLAGYQSGGLHQHYREPSVLLSSSSSFRKRNDDDCSLITTIPSIVVGNIADDGVQITVAILTAHVGD